MYRISIQPARDFASLARRWQALEPHSNPGFFRKWVFMGCLAEDRFAEADLLAVTQDGHDVALALLGHGGGTVWLNQTGDPLQDAVFIEHNGMLAAQQESGCVAAALRGSRHACSLELSGVDDATIAAARKAGWLHVRQSRFAPSIAIGSLDRPYVSTLSANARSQIRRSQRLYGPDLRLVRAESVEAAQGFFYEMVEMHQAAWRARGHPGAFANPHMRAFHTALIARAHPLGQADMVRVTAGARHIGTLYNLIADGRVHCYQSGFAYSADGREKPGLCCHALAIMYYAAKGAKVYDLMAGAERYKLTLAQGGQMLHWGTLHRPWSTRGLGAKALRMIKGGSDFSYKKR